MGFLKLNRYGDSRGDVFDPDAVVQRLRQTFANVKVLAGDQLELSADRAAAASAPEHVVRTLRRNQEEYGPAYAFEIGIDRGTIQGRARRFDVTFLFTDSLPESWRQRLLAFLRSLGSGKIEHGSDGIARST